MHNLKIPAPERLIIEFATHLDWQMKKNLNSLPLPLSHTTNQRFAIMHVRHCSGGS